MAKPTQPIPTWASDTNFASGPDAGSPTKATPSAGIMSQGQVPGTFFGSQWWNYLINTLGVWLAYFNTWISSSEEIVYPVAKTRQIGISALGGSSGKYYLDTSGPTLALVTLESGWRADEDATFGFSKGEVFCPEIGVGYYVDLTPHLRTGMVLGSVTAWVDPGSAQAVVGDRMGLRVTYTEVQTNTSTLINGDVTDATANAQGITVTLGSHVVDLGARTYMLRVVSSQGADPAARDILRGFWLNFTEPAGTCGPRNY